MNDGDRIPTAIRTGTFRLFGVEIHVHVLDDGRRVIEEDSLATLFALMGSGAPVDFDAMQQEIEAFARWTKGLPERAEGATPVSGDPEPPERSSR